MKKIIILLLCISIFSQIVVAQETGEDDARQAALQQVEAQRQEALSIAEHQRQEIIQKAEALKNQCIQNIEECDCSVLGDAQAIARCEEAYAMVYSKFKAFADACFKDLEACDCSQAGDTEIISLCEKEKRKYLQKIQAIVLVCMDDPYKCDCSSLGEHAGKCEIQVEIGRQVKEHCQDDLDTCDCSPIENEAARTSCENAKKYALEFKSKFQKQCKEDPMNCDCSTIPDAAGVEECRKAKETAVKQAEQQIGGKFNECFSDIDNCDCSSMPTESHRKYCEDYIEYGKLCRDTGEMCEKLEDFEIIPAELPEFLKPYFKKTLKVKIDAEKEKEFQKGAAIAQKCVMDPEECDCSGIPIYVRDFCQEKKGLQIRCIFEKDIEACSILDASVEVVPPGAPKFIKGVLDTLLRPLANLQKQQIKGKYAEETKDLILSCIDDVDNCDCSDVPMQYRLFCEAKIQKVKKCYDKNYDMCFTLLEETNLPEDIPGFIKIFIEGDVNKRVKKKGEQMYLKMRYGKCKELNLDECRELWKKGEI